MLDSDLTFLSYTFDGSLIGEFTTAVTRYEHEHIEGSYRASWTLEELEGIVTEASLRAWFRNKMMTRVDVLYKGNLAWSGFVWDMELEFGSVVLKKDMTDVVNTISVKYQPVDGDGAADGDPIYVEFDDEGHIWIVHSESVTLYGRHEELMDSDGGEDEATERAKVTLQYRASPFNTSAVFKPIEKVSLRVTAVGRMVPANKVILLDDKLRYHPDYTDLVHGRKQRIVEGEEVQWTVGHEIRRIVDVLEENGDWLHVEFIADNNTLTRMGTDSVTPAFDRLVSLAKLRNQDEEYYYLFVNPDGGVVYDKMSSIADMILTNTHDGVVTYPDGTIPTWQARPGLIRRLDESVGPELPDTWLDDRQLLYAERVSMSDGDEAASYHSRTFDIGDYYSELDKNMNWMNTEPEDA